MSQQVTKQAHFLTEWREAAKLRLADMVEVTGKSVATLSKVETGHYPYSQALLEAYAGQLGVRPADLLMHPDEVKDRRYWWELLGLLDAGLTLMRDRRRRDVEQLPRPAKVKSRRYREIVEQFDPDYHGDVAASPPAKRGRKRKTTPQGSVRPSMSIRNSP